MRSNAESQLVVAPKMDGASDGTSPSIPAFQGRQNVTEDQRQTPTNDPKHQQRLASITAKAKEISTLTPDDIRQKTAQLQAALIDRQKRACGG
jgi:hypothetical protein